MNTQSAAPKSSIPSFSSFASVLLALLMAGCAARPLKGGHALTAPKPGGRLEQTLSQGDNPSQPSIQTQETLRLRTYTVPAGSQFEFPSLVAPKRSEGGLASPAAPRSDAPRSDAPRSTFLPAPNRNSKIANPKFERSALPTPHSALPSLLLSAPMPVTEREETRATTQLGAAQKDTARELGAKLTSLRGIVWVGLGLFLFGLGTMFYAPLRAVIGSLTTSLAITLGGLALMVLPTLIVGNELLILAAVAVAIGLWFLAHRHGQLRGQVTSLSPSTPAPRPASSPETPFDP